MKATLNAIVTMALIAVSPLLSLYVTNWTEIRLYDLVNPLVLALIGSQCIYLIALLIFQNRRSAYVYAALATFYIFSFGSLLKFISSSPYLARLPLLSPKKIIVLAGLISIVTIGSYILKKGTRTRVNNLFLLFGIMLILHPLFLIISHEAHRTPTPKIKTTNPLEKGSTNLETPDIFYIIIERYASFHVLKNRFKVNPKIQPFLKRNNFYIASSSSPNYPHTSLSLASSLNLNYIQDLIPTRNRLGGDQSHLFKLMSDSRVLNYLKQEGYTSYNLGDSWQGTQRNDNSDYNYSYYGPLPAFTRLFIQQTFIGTLYEKIQYTVNDGIEQHKIDKRNSEEYKIEKLKKIIKDDGKKFVFAHILVTHEPYVLNIKGQPQTNQQLDTLTHEDKYRNHILYSDIILRDVIKTIQSNKRPSIILLQADEGPYPSRLRESIDRGNFSWSTTMSQDRQDHMSILNAYYFPDSKFYQKLYPSISPVNSFRVIFNSYFNQNLDMLRDRYYVNKDFDNLYTFTEITQELQNTNEQKKLQ